MLAFSFLVLVIDDNPLHVVLLAMEEGLRHIWELSIRRLLRNSNQIVHTVVLVINDVDVQNFWLKNINLSIMSTGTGVGFGILCLLIFIKEQHSWNLEIC